MSLRRMRAVMRKEALHILRDPRSLYMALAVPVILLVFFGFALSLDVDRIPTLIHDADSSPQSRDLIARFLGSRFFAVQGYVTDGREIERAIDRNKILMGISIPRDYGRQVLAGREAEVQILIDGSDSNTAGIALGYAEGVVRTYAFELRRKGLARKGGASSAPLAPPVEARFRVWYNSQLQSKNYVVPGLIAVILMIIAALLTSLTIAREWETGTMEQLLSTPVRPAELVLGKMLAYFAVGVIDSLIAVGIGLVVFKVPFRGNPLVLIISACIFLVGALFWGIFLSAVTRNQLLAFQAGLISSFLPAFLLSGFVYAIEGMPVVVQAISYIFPTRYFVSTLKGVFLKGVGPEVLWVEGIFLIAFSILVFVAAVRKLRGKLA